MAVDLEIEAVVAGVVLAGGEVADLLTAGEIEGGSGWEIELGPLEDFLSGDATGFDVVNDVVDGETLGLLGCGREPGGEGEAVAELQLQGSGVKRGGDFGLFSKTEER